MFGRLTIATALAAMSAPALAQAPAKADEDKPITRAQISDKLDADYADLDANKDGKVDAAEINARLKKGAEADLEIIRKERDATFAKFDADGNGQISKAEFEAHAKLPTIKEPDAKPFLDRFDANKDGTISKDEFRTPTISNFERLDKNKDGTLSVAEQSSSSATASKAPVKKAVVKETPPIGR
jgi:Ca2+-binding EF-hand superfamily protein